MSRGILGRLGQFSIHFSPPAMGRPDGRYTAQVYWRNAQITGTGKGKEIAVLVDEMRRKVARMGEGFDREDKLLSDFASQQKAS